MATRLDDLLAHIARLERDVEDELAQARQRWRYRIEAGRVRFEHDVWLAHKRIKQSIPRFIKESSPRNLVTAPFIYSLLVPIALLDVWITLYQWVCFPIYGIARVRRSTYIATDRHHLGATLTRSSDSIATTAAMPTGCSRMSARWRAGPNSSGARSGTPAAFPHHTCTIASSSTTATPRVTTDSCRSCAPV